MRVLTIQCRWQQCQGNLALDEKTGETRCLRCNREHTESGKLILPKVGKKLHPYAKKHKGAYRRRKEKS
ncbi:MAG TPA: hypothetical protein VMW64_07090 [Dehalococcoidia bacterium]|nr:hypothetical protein [Dehalococcoidia bacterium]